MKAAPLSVHFIPHPSSLDGRPPSPWSYCRFLMLRDETIFLTGLPGFIAGRLLERLARGGARFLLLVQPAFVERARKEIAALVEKTGATPESFRVVEGDITRERSEENK